MSFDRLKKLHHNIELVNLITKINYAKGHDEKYKYHKQLQKYCKKRSINLDDYKDEYHEFMYKKIADWKIWKDNNKKWHRDRKVLVDGVLQTLPAFITKDSRSWYHRGLHHREDRGKDGLLLPAEIHDNGVQFWFWKGKMHNEEKCFTDGYLQTRPARIWPCGSKFWLQESEYHRAELGPDGKALPAIIYNDRPDEYYYHETKYSRKDLTKKLLKENKPLKLDNKYKLVFNNGDCKLSLKFF